MFVRRLHDYQKQGNLGVYRAIGLILKGASPKRLATTEARISTTQEVPRFFRCSQIATAYLLRFLVSRRAKAEGTEAWGLLALAA